MVDAAKLTKDDQLHRPVPDRSLEALAVLDAWRNGMQISTASLRYDGVSLAVLRSLEVDGFVDSERANNGLFWRITSAGRALLRSIEGGERG